MTHIEELREAVTVISVECKLHQHCRECPLFSVTCSCGGELYYPASWTAEMIGVEDNE